MKINPFYQIVDPDLWQGRKETLKNQRFYQIVQVLNENYEQQETLEKTLNFIGFCSDLGVQRNHGRVGAKEAPNAIRKILANLPCHLSSSLQLFDVGNIQCPNDDLEAAQAQLGEQISLIRKKKGFVFVLGGGHETAWGHYLGLEDLHHSQDFAILNFDAHFDMRPCVKGLGNSGTAFLQMAEHRKDNQLATCSITDKQAPITCGWQRIE